MSKSPHSAVGWVFLPHPQLPEGGCTVRWRRGDSMAHVLAGRKVGATVADGQVLARLDVPESGWVDLTELRTRGETWLRETLTARRANVR